MILLLLSVAMATSIQPSVELSSDSDAVHLLVGAEGEQVSSCGLTSDGWGCQPMDVERSQPMAILLDTTMVRLGTVEPESANMMVQVRDGVAEVVWNEDPLPFEPPKHEVFVVRLTGASADPAPMVNITYGGQNAEARCGDDGRFPDSGINDGVFTCSLVTTAVNSADKEATFQLRLGPVEEQPLGSVEYVGPPGLRFAQLTVGDPGAAKGDPFTLPVGIREADQGAEKPDVLSPKEVAIESGEYVEVSSSVPASTVPLDARKGRSSLAPTSGWVGTILALCLVIVGVLMGRYSRRGVSTRLEGTEPVALNALDGQGPVPENGAVIVHADPPVQALLHIARALTPYRRLVMVGREKPTGLQPALDVVWVTDPDWRSITSLVKEWSSDGGVPVVVLIDGIDSIMDVGGASPSPVLILLEALESHAWVAIVERDGGAADLALPRWDWFTDRGWAAR